MAGHFKEISPHVLETAKRLMADGASWYKAARAVGLSYDGLRRRLDPAYQARVNEKLAARKYAPLETLGRYIRPITDEELKARKALIPFDCRDLTARLLGDPIPNDPRRMA